MEQKVWVGVENVRKAVCWEIEGTCAFCLTEEEQARERERREKLGEGAGVGGREERRRVSRTERQRERNSELLAYRSCWLGVWACDRECFLSRRVGGGKKKRTLLFEPFIFLFLFFFFLKFHIRASSAQAELVWTPSWDCAKDPGKRACCQVRDQKIQIKK